MRRSPRLLRTTTLVLTAAALLLSGLLTAPGAAAADPPPRATDRLWDRVTGEVADTHRGNPAAISLEEFRAFELDHAGMAAALAAAPREFSGQQGLELSLPSPDGGFDRFTINESPVMEPALAAQHPEIATYNGEGITDPTATVRLSLTPIGFHASVRGSSGPWYIEPYYRADRSLYASYFKGHGRNTQGSLDEPLAELRQLVEDAAGRVTALPGLAGEVHDEHEQEDEVSAAASGGQLRTYRLALASDPGYAAFHGAANVTAAKVTLVNRVTHIYEDESAIRLVLIGNNNNLNFNTAALATQPNGPCGTAACYTTTQLSDCTGGLLDRNRIVVGQVIGASNFDIGHIVLATNGGVARGGVGSSRKAEGCTGLPNPVGDAFAVDYVAHEMGHQFTASHTWNGINGSCGAGQYASGAAVEPGSASSIMGYAGICGDNNLQSNSDPYWSQKSYEQVDTYVTSAQPAINEVQNAALRGFDTNGDSFTLTYGGNTSGTISRGPNYVSSIQAALVAILPVGATAAVAGFGGSGAPDDTGFQVTFGGTLAGDNAAPLTITNPSGMSGFVGEIDKGGPPDNQGAQTSTGNSPPSVTAPASFTIPYRTPFALTGGGSDPDGDTLTYLWEQNNAGPAQSDLRSSAKSSGPLFRQFGRPLDSSVYVGTDYDAAGMNHPTASPTRVFPDMAQILANNTNARTGTCSGTGVVDCFSEFLPTSGYTGPMNFRLTARDGRAGGGGVNSADTVVNLAPGTGPFLVTDPNTAVTWQAETPRTVTWDVAGTSAPPVNTAQVEILLSTDGGASFPHVLASSTANDGSADITVPDVETTTARMMVRALGNIFFDVSDSDFTIIRSADMELASLADSQDPAYAGETLTYTVRARNNGPSNAVNARVVDVLPAGLTYATSSSPCAQAPAGTLTCGLGTLAAGEERTFTITASIRRDLVHNNGSPLTVTDVATAASDRPDPEPTNNQKSQATLIKAKADLGILDFAAVNPPSELIIGQDATVTIRTLMTNEGPSAPMDVRTDGTASSTPNASVAPAVTSDMEPALGYSEDRTVDETFTVSCTAPGQATFTFTKELSPDRPDDHDPALADNTDQTAFTVDCIVPVAVNIKPGSFLNPVNRMSKGVIPLAVLTTTAGEYGLPLAFDATRIQPSSVRFGPEAAVVSGGGAPESHPRAHIEDAIERSDERTRDGDRDMVMHFGTQESAFSNESEGCVRGQWTGPGGEAFLFHGCDLVTLK